MFSRSASRHLFVIIFRLFITILNNSITTFKVNISILIPVTNRPRESPGQVLKVRDLDLFVKVTG